MAETGEVSSYAAFSMDDVTSKIAYAYAKQQVFVFLGLVSVVMGALLVGSEWPMHAGDTYLEVLDDVLLLLGGVGILTMAFTQKDLKRVNRHALAILAIVGLVKLLVFALSATGVAVLEDSPDLGDDIGVAAVFILALASYPFPTRRGSELFSPARIRELSDARTLVFAALVGLVTSASAFPGASEAGASSGLFMPALSDDVGLIVIGLVGLVLFLVLKNGPKLVLWLSVVVGAELLFGVLGFVDEIRNADAFGDDLPKIVVAALALLVVYLLSARLNQGKTIVDRRA